MRTGATTARPVTARIAVSILASTIETLVFPVMALLRFVFRCFSHGARHYADNVRDSTSDIPRRTSSASRSHSCTSGIWSAAMAVRTISPHVRHRHGASRALFSVVSRPSRTDVRLPCIIIAANDTTYWTHGVIALARSAKSAHATARKP